MLDWSFGPCILLAKFVAIHVFILNALRQNKKRLLSCYGSLQNIAAVIIMHGMDKTGML